MATVVTPIGNVDREPSVWHWNAIYMGTANLPTPVPVGLKRQIAVVGDIVIHPLKGNYSVTFVNDEFMPTLKQIPAYTGGTEDVIIAPAGNFLNAGGCLRVDSTTLPIRFNVDSTSWVYRSNATHYKIFRGYDITNNGVCISAQFNAQGLRISENIELELLAINNVTNMAIKGFKSGYLTELPNFNDTVTLVVYASNGDILETRSLAVTETSHVAKSSRAVKTIVDISLDSPYVSESDATLLEYPFNLNLSAAGLFGVVTYNDGSVARLPVNGGKFRLDGIRAFTASSAGQTASVVLNYELSDDEQASLSTGDFTGHRSKTKAYKIRTQAADGAYSVKLFAVPTWDKTGSQWKLRYYLYNLSRDIHQDVTSLIEPNIDFAFNGKVYNSAQTVKVALNLMNVGSRYKNYRHVQSFNITLLQPGSAKNVPSYWNLSYSSDVNVGVSLRADKTGSGSSVSFDFSAGCTTLEQWLNKVYYPTEPIRALGVENIPPAPTRFRLKGASSGTVYAEREIAEVIGPVANISSSAGQGDTLVLEFFTLASGDEVELSCVGLNINVPA